MIEKSGQIQPYNALPVAHRVAGEKTGDVPKDSFVKSDVEKKPEKEWTVLAYMSGSHELREYMTSNLKEMEAVGSTDNMNVAVYLSRDKRSWSPGNIATKISELFKRRPSVIDNPWTGSRVYHVQKGNPDSREIESNLVQDRGREKVRDPQNLKQFLEWGMKEFPAKHYMVILSSHGNGFNGTLMDRDGKMMSPGEVREAVEGAEETTGRRVDVLAAEACQMGQMEVAYEMKDAADFFVASPGRMFSNAFNYKTILGEVDKYQKGGQKISPEDMAAILVESTEGFYDDVPTLTALDLREMGNIKSALDNFAASLIKTKTPGFEIRRLIFESPEHDKSVYSKKKRSSRDFIDIIGFCNRIISSDKVDDQGLKANAARLKDSINKATVHKKVHYDDPNDRGLAIYCPTDRSGKGKVSSKYKDLKMSKESNWIDYINGDQKSLLKALTGAIAGRLGI